MWIKNVDGHAMMVKQTSQCLLLCDSSSSINSSSRVTVAVVDVGRIVRRRAVAVVLIRPIKYFADIAPVAITPCQHLLSSAPAPVPLFNFQFNIFF